MFVRKREKERDCFQIAQAPKKRHFFSFPTWPTRKKDNKKKGEKEAKRAVEVGEGKLLGTVQRGGIV